MVLSSHRKHAMPATSVTISKNFNLEQLKAATRAGGVMGITLRGDGAAFVVNVQTQRGQAVMVTSRQQPRRFADPSKALQVLRGIGLTDCRVDTTEWRPEDRALEKTARPDRSLALKAAHEAAQQDVEYDRWFHAKVQASLDGIEDGTNRVYTEAEWKVKRRELQAKLKALQVVKQAA